MVQQTAIEWADHTFNPWEGCQKAGPGCANCYAEARNARFAGGEAPNFGTGAPRRRTSVANWQTPLRWQADAAAFANLTGRRQRVFCASLADVFDNAVDPQWRADLAILILKTLDLDWLLLTKRIGNAAAMLKAMFGDEMPANVWLGATIVNQAEADRDIPKLLATPAARRFLSMEPLLGPVDLTRVQAPRFVPEDHELDWKFSALQPGSYYEFEDTLGFWNCGDGPERETSVDWVIVGGESGRGARPMHPDWVVSIRDQCEAAGTPFLFKQWGEHLPVFVDYVSRSGIEFRRVGKKVAGRRLHGVTHDGVPA